MKMKVYAGIVTYYPDINLLRKNIESIAHQVDKLIVVDNASDNSIEIKKIVDGISNGLLFCNKKNKGIAYALNLIMETSYEENANWVLLLDQDSTCPSNLIQEYLKYAHRLDVAVITPGINDVNDIDKNEIDKRVELVIEFITSGSLNRVDIWRKMGGFNEDLFIDMVDYDYAYRLCNKGYKAIKVNEISLDHAIGKRSYHRIGIIKCSTYNHNAFRKYYITRNSLFLARTYPEYCNIYLMYLRIFKRMLIVLLFEENKWEKIINMIKGIRDSKKITKNYK